MRGRRKEWAVSGTVRVFKNMLSLLSDRVLVPLLNLLIVVCIARVMGTKGLGQYSAVVGFVSFFDIFLDLGMDTLIIREVSRDRSSAHRISSKAMTLKLAVFPFVLVSIAVFLSFFSYPPDVVHAFYIFSAAFLLAALSDTYTSLFKAWERMDLHAFIALVSQVVLLVGITAAAYAGYGITGMAIANLIVCALSLVFSHIIFNRKLDRVMPGLDMNFHKRLFDHSLPFITLGFFFMMFHRVDVVSVSAVAGDVEAGYFSVASKISASLLLLSAVFLEAVFPIISRYEQDADAKMRTAVKNSFHLLSIVSFPMAVGLALTGGEFVRMLFGPGFGNSTPMLAVLSFTFPFAYLASALHYVAIAREMQKKSFFGIVVTVVVWALICIMLVVRYGGMGAAIATLAMTVSVFLFLARLVFREVRDYSALTEMLRPLAAALVMAASLYMMRDVWVVLRAVAGAAVYAAALWAMGGVYQADARRFREIWRHFIPDSAGGREAGS